MNYLKRMLKINKYLTKELFEGHYDIVKEDEDKIVFVVVDETQKEILFLEDAGQIGDHSFCFFEDDDFKEVDSQWLQVFDLKNMKYVSLFISRKGDAENYIKNMLPE